MTYVPGYKWDVFISYARHDDAIVFAGERGWVSAFVDVLRVAVRGFLGEEFNLYWDRLAAGSGNTRLEEMKIAAANAAAFVVIASPSYCRREWPMAELDSFRAQCDDPHRLFVAEHLPRDDGDEYPEILAEKNYVEFWRRLADSPAADALAPTSTEFRAKLTDFAYKLQKHLRAMRAAREKAEQSPPRPPEPPEPPAPVVMRPREAGRAAPARPTVLVAQVTDDVAGLADEVQRYLEQFSDVVGILPCSAYPQGGADFSSGFLDDLERSDIFVQLLGASPGRTPPDLPQGYTRFQLEAARAGGKAILQWRHPELDVDGVADEAHRALLADPHVIVTGLENFKARIVELARKPVADEPDHPNPTKVFVNADRQNLTTAQGIATLFSAADYDPVLPRFDGTVQENRAHLYQAMSDCGVVLVVNGVRPPIWFDTQKNLFETLRPARKAEPAALAVCSVPPADQLNPEMIGGEFFHIDCTDGWDPGRVKDYIGSLKQPAQPQPEPQPQPEA